MSGYLAGGGYGLVVGYIYALIAFCLWTSFIPIAAWQAELNPQRKNIIAMLFSLGIFLSLYDLYAMAYGLSIDCSMNQVRYALIYPTDSIFEYAYAFCVVAPLFISSNKYLNLFGGLVLLFFAVSSSFFNPARFSTWCFFAALSSSLIYIFVSRYNNEPHGSASFVK